MLITNIETFVLSNRRALVKVSTDRGISGWGEPVLENWARTTIAAVERMSEYLLGRDPRRITDLWQRLDRGGFYRGGPVLRSAVAGLDQALWDIKGRALGAPVHELLGGPTRDAARIYGPAGGGEDRAGDLELCRTAVTAGTTMVKAVPAGAWRFLESESRMTRFVDELHEIRATVGPTVDIALDFHGRLSAAQAIRLLPMLEDLHPVFVEEPVRPEQLSALGRIVASTSIPIAMGERMYSRFDFAVALDSGVSIVQPDLSHAGGITECFRIAAQAELYDAAVAPHCPLGPVALAACLQIDFAVPNFYVQEQGMGLHYGGAEDLDLLHNPEVLIPSNGSIARLTGPGLGVEVDEDAVRSRATSGPLTPGSPIWSHEDGSFAEW